MRELCNDYNCPRYAEYDLRLQGNNDDFAKWLCSKCLDVYYELYHKEW